MPTATSKRSINSGWTGSRAFEDVEGPDRAHAAETLGKLGHTVDAADPQTLAPWRAFAQQGPRGDQALARWVLLNSAVEDAEQQLAELLDSTEPMGAGIAAYAFQFRPQVTRQTWDKLARLAVTVGDPDRQRLEIFYALPPDLLR